MRIHRKFLTAILALCGTQAFADGGAKVAPEAAPEVTIKKPEKLVVVSDTKKIKFSGFINRAEMWLNNGDHSNTANVDNFSQPSRLNITGTGAFDEDVTVGGTFEVGFFQNSSNINDVHNAQSNSDSEANFPVRKAEIFVDSFSWGKLSLGRGDMAAAYTAEETDLSGTRCVATGANIWRLAPGASFYNKTTGLNKQYFVYANDALEGVFTYADSYQRHDRIRYDTPKFYGIMLSGSHGYQSSGDIFDVAARFAGKFFGVKVAADAAFEHDHSVTDFHYKQVNGSIGVLFPLSFTGKENTGLNFFFSASHRDWELEGQADGKFYVGKVGYLDRFFSFGKTAIAADYGWSKGMTISCEDDDVDVIDTAFTNKGTSWGVYLVQDIDVVATNAYVGYREYRFKKIDSIMKFEPIKAFVVGALVKL